MAEQSANRFESNEVLRWSEGEFVSVNGVGDPGHGELADGYEHSIVVTMSDGANTVALDFGAHEARRVATAINRAADAVAAHS